MEVYQRFAQHLNCRITATYSPANSYATVSIALHH
jgi:hypothetical protein